MNYRHCGPVSAESRSSEEQRMAALCEGCTALLQRYFFSKGVPAADIDDLIQDCLFVVWRRHAYILLGKEERFLLATAKRRWKAYRRKAAIQHAGGLILGDSVPDWLAKSLRSPEHSTIAPETDAPLRQAINELPSRMKEVIQLIYTEGLTRAEAARRLGVTQPAVHKSEHGALHRLRRAMEMAKEAPDDRRLPRT